MVLCTGPGLWLISGPVTGPKNKALPGKAMRGRAADGGAGHGDGGHDDRLAHLLALPDHSGRALRTPEVHVTLRPRGGLHAQLQRHAGGLQSLKIAG